MKYNESFTKNNNPVNFNGVMGRLPFIGFNILYMIVSGAMLWHFCPKFIATTANNTISQNKTIIELLMSYAQTNEMWIYIISTFVGMFLGFVLNKKRFLDIIGEGPNSLRLSLIYSSVLFLHSLQSNFFAPQGTLQAGFLGITTFIVYVFLYLKKGAITGQKVQQEISIEEEK